MVPASETETQILSARGQAKPLSKIELLKFRRLNVSLGLLKFSLWDDLQHVLQHLEFHYRPSRYQIEPLSDLWHKGPIAKTQAQSLQHRT